MNSIRQTERRTDREIDRQRTKRQRQRDTETERRRDDRERQRDIDRETQHHAALPVHFERTSKLQFILRAERFELPTF